MWKLIGIGLMLLAFLLVILAVLDLRRTKGAQRIPQPQRVSTRGSRRQD